MNGLTKDNVDENRRIWADALRSGDYKQGKGTLVGVIAPEDLATGDSAHPGTEEDAEPGEIVVHCCLGVACDLADAWGAVDEYEVTDVPAIVDDLFGLDEREREALASANDGGQDFHQIAGLVEDGSFREGTRHED